MEPQSLDRRFSLVRVARLLRNRVLDEASTIGIGAAIVLACNLLSLLVSHRAFYNSQGIGPSPWIVTIVLGGLLLAGGSLKAMHDGKSGTEWLLLPATPLEKYAAALADSILFFPLAAAIGAIAMSALLALLERAAGGPGDRVWAPFDARALVAWADYAVAALVLLAGSAAFRKAALLKTAAIFVAFGIAFLGLSALGLLAFFGKHGGSASQLRFFSGWLHIEGAGGNLSERAQKALAVGFKIARYAILPIFAILFGAARVAEKEARDEVQ